MAGLKPETPAWNDEEEAETTVVVWDDPIWTPALHALTEKADSRPIAALLRDGEAPPFEVLEKLGIMLDPPPGFIGHSLTIKTSKKHWRKVAAKIEAERKIRERILELNVDRKLESAITEVGQESNLSRAKLFQILQLDNYEVVRRAETMFGRGPFLPSPRKRR